MEKVKLCPYRTETVIYHNDRKNCMVPNYGINKRMDYDVVNVSFKPCIKEDCMLYDKTKKVCKPNEK